MDKLEEQVEQLKDAATKSENAWEEYMTFFWQGDKYIPRCVRRLIVDFSASQINIKISLFECKLFSSLTIHLHSSTLRIQPVTTFTRPGSFEYPKIIGLGSFYS